MKIFFQEIKKVLRPVPLLILAVFAGFYGIFAYRIVMVSSDREIVYADLVEIVGPKVDMNNPQKIIEAALTLETRYIEEGFNKAIRGNPLFINAGITSYSDALMLEAKNIYSNIDEEFIFNIGGVYPDYDTNADYTITESERVLLDSGELVYAPYYWKLIYVERIFKFINSEIIKDSIYNNEELLDEYLSDLQGWFSLSPVAMERIRDIHDSGEMQYILPLTSHVDLFSNIFIITIATLFILLAPVVTRDNMSGVRSLQYSSKTGRKTLAIQLAAMLFSAFAIAVLQIGIILGAYTFSFWYAFINSGLHSLFTQLPGYNWFSGTYGQFFIAVGLLMLSVSLVITLLLFVFSKMSKNYITLLLPTVPIATAFVFLCVLMFSEPFAIISYNVTLYQMIPIPFVEAYICIAMLLLAAIPAGVVLARQRRAEV
ncbi:MAG: hypothetical protein FWD44_04365 [Oscillospiraceae bacterium]|nr:hypothetical protein [Oscillospiraceae bacterium]